MTAKSTLLFLTALGFVTVQSTGALAASFQFSPPLHSGKTLSSNVSTCAADVSILNDDGTLDKVKVSASGKLTGAACNDKLKAQAQTYQQQATAKRNPKGNGAKVGGTIGTVAGTVLTASTGGHGGSLGQTIGEWIGSWF